MIENPKYRRYLELFRGRDEFFAQQGESGYRPVESQFEEFYLSKHLAGDATFGIYVLDANSECHLLCFDVDIPKSDLPSIDFQDPAAKYVHLHPRISELLELLQSQLCIPHESILLEDTGGRGYHFWIFLNNPLDGSIAVSFGDLVKSKLESEIEFFPKQAYLTPEKRFGNLIKLPLGIHRSYLSWSIFFRIGLSGPEYFETNDANLSHLDIIQPIDPGLIIAIAGETNEKHSVVDNSDIRMHEAAKRPLYKGSTAHLISNCTAMNQLHEKAHSGETLTHAEAFNYANTMLSVPGGVEEIHSSIRKSFGSRYSPERTNLEIEKIRPLHQTSCKTLINQKICPEYCKESVQTRNEDQLLPNTTPCSVWLDKKITSVTLPPEWVREVISDPQRIKLAYLRLKRYQDNEDSLFFDTFDFGQFERRLQENCLALARQFEVHGEAFFSEFLPVSIPKKLSEDLDLEYRKMSYLTIFDQVQIQAIFDAIGPYLDDQFQDSSYGYRWNKDSSSPYRIFEDWKLAYPRFRSQILEAIQRNPDGHHVCCDIKAFYDNVSHEILIQQFREQVDNEITNRIIPQVINHYEFEEGVSRGIPQGPAYARLLANLYLNDFDVFASSLAAGYFRYVDDFVMVFKSVEDAERGLSKIVVKLSDLGLRLSQDAEKKPVVLSNNDLSRVKETLEKIKYGILEGTRHIKYLDPDTIEDFYNAVVRVSGRPSSVEQLLEINQALPSWLYVASEESIMPHPFSTTILEICDYLVRKRIFVPKRLKSVFYRIISLQNDTNKLISLFEQLLPTHKVYFMLSAYGHWKTNDTKKDLLEKILKLAIADDDSYVFGFALGMMASNELDQIDAVTLDNVLEKLKSQENWFALVKFLSARDYFSLSSDQRIHIQKLVTISSSPLVRMHMLGNISRFPERYLDSIYLRGLIREFHPYIIPVATSLFAIATNTSELFRALLDFFVNHPTYKSLTVSLLTEKISEIRSQAGIADIENLNALYCEIDDPEIRQSLLYALEKIKMYSPEYGTEFAKSHPRLDQYHGCFLFEHTEDRETYTHLELIPSELLSNSYGREISLAKSSIDDLSEKQVLPDLDFYFDSRTRDISVRYRVGSEYSTLSKGMYDINSEESVISALKVASDAFKKATYLLHSVGTIPEVSIRNLLVDQRNNEIVFKTIGRSLSPIQIISGSTIGNTHGDISLMIANLISDLLFSTNEEHLTFLEAKCYTPIKAFIAQFIRNMSGRDASVRYSSQRFDFLIEKLVAATRQSDRHVAVIYLRERLRSALFRHNIGNISWTGVSQALNEHVEHVRSICSNDHISKIRFRGSLYFEPGKRNLHRLSKELHNLLNNREQFGQALVFNDSYWDLSEYIVSQSILYIETVSLCRAIPLNLRDFESVDTKKYPPKFQIHAADYAINMKNHEFVALGMYKEDETGIELRDLSLSQISTLILISLGNLIHNHTLSISRPPFLSERLFDDLAYICLVEIPGIEEDMRKYIKDLSRFLAHNEEPEIEYNLSELREKLDNIFRVFHRVRKKLRLHRMIGNSDGKKLPQKIMCTSRTFRKMSTTDRSLPGIPLTNNFPASIYRCSWDVRDGTITNLVIPNEALNKILVDLKKGRLFGRKLSYLYSGQLMLAWDLPIILIFTLLFSIITRMNERASLGLILGLLGPAIAVILEAIIVCLAFKILLVDIGWWQPSIKKLVVYLQAASRKS